MLKEVRGPPPPSPTNSLPCVVATDYEKQVAEYKKEVAQAKKESQEHMQQKQKAEQVLLMPPPNEPPTC